MKATVARLMIIALVAVCISTIIASRAAIVDRVASRHPVEYLGFWDGADHWRLSDGSAIEVRP